MCETIENSAQNSQNEKRAYWIDAARVFAIISISLNHAVNRSFSTGSGSMQEFLTIPIWLSVCKAVCNVFSRIGVPIFLMITGALMLKRDYSTRESVEKFYKHNWGRIFITAELWYAIMFWYRQINPDSIMRTKGLFAAIFGFVKNQLFIDQVTMGSMWYMAMILCAYTMIPIAAVALKKIPYIYTGSRSGIVWNDCSQY